MQEKLKSLHGLLQISAWIPGFLQWWTTAYKLYQKYTFSSKTLPFLKSQSKMGMVPTPVKSVPRRTESTKWEPWNGERDGGRKQGRKDFEVNSKILKLEM